MRSFSYIPRLAAAALCVGFSGGPWAAEPEAAARIVSIQNQVETRPSPPQSWISSTLHEPLGGGSRVRTGAASRAGILYADQTLHRLGEKSEIEIQPATPERPGLLRLLFGSHYFSSRTPQQFDRIETPTVAAAIQGTEFVVDVREDTTTTITMIEGIVVASNPFGSLTIRAGEQAYVEPGTAPVKRILVRPADAVAWALYYPPVIGGADAERLAGLGEDGRDLARAAAFLASGQVEQARPLIEGVRGRRPGEPLALALASVIEVAASRKEEALHLAEQALAADPRSPAAALALSFAAQAAFDIPLARAMAERAAEADPDNALALARAAELRMAEGDLDGAEALASRAVERAPGESRALAVLGFAKLAKLRSTEAEPFLVRAVSADPESSLARLGLGLARIRLGRLREGREEIQIAAALDPDDSLLRSYLGKAYYEEKRDDEAGKELAAAKQLDPSDPTPYLYDAIRKQNENRPAEALWDLRESIVRNDRRAVYRSRLLLDEDLAVRGADLSRIYNDLGFEQLGVVTARRSAAEDHANHSGHLLLAGTYRSLPDFAPAFFSEVLQARIYQPVSVNAARPDLVNETASFNEYTALFERPRARAFASASYGRTDTGLEELFPPGDPLLDAVRIEESTIHAGEIVATLNHDRFSAALGYRRFSTDGFRVNNDQAVANYRGFVEFAPTHRDSIQLNLLVGRQESGDLPLRTFPVQIASERLDSDLWNLGLGYHRILSPGSDLAVSVIHNRTEQAASDPFFGAPGGKAVLEGPQIEVQHVLRRASASLVSGAGLFRGEFTLAGEASPALVTDDRFASGYAYGHLEPLRWLALTIGAAVEDATAPTGLQPPRDSLYVPAEIEHSTTRLSPKLGVSVHGGRTKFRAAAFSRLSPAIGRIQTLEPTQVAGFNQFFSEPGGTRSRSYGLGADHDFGRRLFAGFSVLRRRSDSPEASCELPDPFSGCIGQPVTRIVERDATGDHGSAYLDTVLGKRLALALDYSYAGRRFDTTRVDNQSFFEERIKTHRLVSGLRWFLPSGWVAGAKATWYDQRVEERDAFDPAFAGFRNLQPSFWIVDLNVGYRLPKRWGTVQLEARNVGDQEFESFERAVEETFIPARVVIFSVVLTH